MKHVATILLFTLAGCSTLSGGSKPSNDPQDAFADIYVMIREVADATTRACGNAEPGGDCQPGALVSTEDRDKVQRDLRGVLGHVDTARELRKQALANNTSSRPALRALSTAIVVLQGVEGILIARGVTTEEK